MATQETHRDRLKASGLRMIAKLMGEHGITLTDLASVVPDANETTVHRLDKLRKLRAMADDKGINGANVRRGKYAPYPKKAKEVNDGK